jgi:hypothetical protein
MLDVELSTRFECAPGARVDALSAQGARFVYGGNSVVFSVVAIEAKEDADS